MHFHPHGELVHSNKIKVVGTCDLKWLRQDKDISYKEFSSMESVYGEW